MKNPTPPPAPTARPNVSRHDAPVAITLDIQKGKVTGRDRIAMYGTAGVGKSSLAAMLPKPLFVDVEEGSSKLNVSRVTASTWTDLRGTLTAIANDPPKGFRTIVLDTITRAQTLAEEHVIATYKTERGEKVDSLEKFSFGKGWKFLADEMMKLMADLDRIVAAGLNVCVIAHDVSTTVPNPAGEDFLRWEPRLHSGDKNGRGDIRGFLKGWSDHLLFVTYDVSVRDGKAIGAGSRSIYTTEYATHVAKSRSFDVADVIPFDIKAAGAVWDALAVS